MTKSISHSGSVLNRRVGFISPLENLSFSNSKFWMWVYSHWRWVWPQFIVYSHATVITAILKKWSVWPQWCSWIEQSGEGLHALQPAGTAPLTSAGLNPLTIQSSEATYQQPVGERNFKNFIFQLALKWKWLICRTSFKESGFFGGSGECTRSHTHAFKCVSDIWKQVCSTCVQSRLESSLSVNH